MRNQNSALMMDFAPDQYQHKFGCLEKTKFSSNNFMKRNERNDSKEENKAEGINANRTNDNSRSKLGKVGE